MEVGLSTVYSHAVYERVSLYRPRGVRCQYTLFEIYCITGIYNSYVSHIHMHVSVAMRRAARELGEVAGGAMEVRGTIFFQCTLYFFTFLWVRGECFVGSMCAGAQAGGAPDQEPAEIADGALRNGGE